MQVQNKHCLFLGAHRRLPKWPEILPQVLPFFKSIMCSVSHLLFILFWMNGGWVAALRVSQLCLFSKLDIVPYGALPEFEGT
jgi:hypothetical protein